MLKLRIHFSLIWLIGTVALWARGRRRSRLNPVNESQSDNTATLAADRSRFGRLRRRIVLTAAIAGTGVALALFIVNYRKAAHQYAAVRVLANRGATVLYDYQSSQLLPNCAVHFLTAEVTVWDSIRKNASDANSKANTQRTK